MSSDERLARRASRGEARAFEAIYRRYHQDLYRFCLAMVGNRQDAQDALQNTMVKVLRSLPGEEREIWLKPWLYRIARNESIETLRKRRDHVELEPHQAVGTDVVEAAETRERLRTLLTDLEQLPERQRSVLVMRELAGLDFDEIGAAFATSSAVARQALYEARLSLRRLEAGREMRCADVKRELSDADGRVTRRREIRAHLRACAGCRAFRDDIGRRQEDFAALTPLPLAASAALLQSVIGNASAGGTALGGGGLAGGIGAGAGKAAATSVVVKSAATAAVVAIIGVSAAERGGLVDLPLPGREEPGAAQGTTTPETPAAGNAEVSARTVPPERAAAEGRGDAGVAGVKGDDAVRGDDTSAAGDQGDGAVQGSGTTNAEHGSDGGNGPASTPSNSVAGLDPPGEGFGRGGSEGNGRPDSLPDAASHGQQTAAAGKPAHAGQGNAGGGGKPEAGGGQSATKPAPAADTTAPAPGPPPHAEGPSQADGDPPGKGPDAPPPGHQH